MSDASEAGGVRAASIPEELPREAVADVATRLLAGGAGDTGEPGAAARGAEAGVGGAVLVLRVRDERVRVREMGAYLALIDRLYGRLRPGGLRSYAQIGSEQLRLRRIATGDSALLEIEEDAEWARPWRIALLYLALKLLPGIVEGSGSWAEAFRGLQDGAGSDPVQVGLFSAADGSLRGRLGEEPALAGARRPFLEAVALLLEDFYAAEGDLLPAALRFARASVLGVSLRLG